MLAMYYDRYREPDDSVQFWCEWFQMKISMLRSMGWDTFRIRWRLKEDLEKHEESLPEWRAQDQWSVKKKLNLMEALRQTIKSLEVAYG